MYELYELIWNRFVACQMSAAVFDQTTVDVRGGDYVFRDRNHAAVTACFRQNAKKRADIELIGSDISRSA